MALSGKVHLRSELKIESDWEDEWALLMKELRWLRKKKLEEGLSSDEEKRLVYLE